MDIETPIEIPAGRLTAPRSNPHPGAFAPSLLGDLMSHRRRILLVVAALAALMLTPALGFLAGLLGVL